MLAYRLPDDPRKLHVVFAIEAASDLIGQLTFDDPPNWMVMSDEVRREITGLEVLRPIPIQYRGGDASSKVDGFMEYKRRLGQPSSQPPPLAYALPSQ